MSTKLDKIKKLLALSKSDNEQEAANALAMAMQYASEEGVDLGTLDLNDEDILTQDYSCEPQSKKLERWKTYLWIRVSRIFGCAIYGNSFFDRDFNLRHRIKIAGRKSDIEIADYVGSYLQRELLRLSRKELSSVCKRRKIPRSRLRDSFLLGAAVRVTDLAERIFQRDAQAGVAAGYEIILSRASKAQAYVDAKPNMTPVKYKDKIDDRAFNSGFSRAGGITISKGIGSADNPRKQIRG